MTGEALHSVAGGLGGGVRNTHVKWSLMTPSREILFEFEEIQLILFQLGIGFIVVRASPIENDQDVNNWFDFSHYFCSYQGRRKIYLRALRKVQANLKENKFQYIPFFPEPAGGLQFNPEGKGTLEKILHSLYVTTIPEDMVNPAWDEVFVRGQLVRYSALFIDDVQDEAIPLLRYRLRNFYHSSQELHPSQTDIDDGNKALLPYAKDQCFYFSLEGGGFVAFNAPSSEFFRNTLPDHLAKKYFLAFLLTTTQRFALLTILDQVNANWPIGGNLASNIDEIEFSFNHAQTNFMNFTAQGYFGQAMQREHYDRYYKKWQEIYQSNQLYQEVNNNLLRIQTFLEQKRGETSYGDKHRYSSELRQIIESNSLNQAELFQVGKKLNGRFEILKILSPTNHSLVIKARDVTLARLVAIKFPRLDYFDKEIILMFQKNIGREAKVLAKLEHQNIGRIFDIMDEPIGIIMEWIDGDSLQEIINKNESISISQVVKIGIELGEALEYSHYAGVVHRDIKPGNIILTKNGTTKLIDFDIAKDQSLESISLGKDGVSLNKCTIRYCSPEQISLTENPNITNVGPKTDIFSLGLVLFELITKNVPFPRGNHPSYYPENHFPPLDSSKIVDRTLYNLLSSMLLDHPDLRPDAEVLVKDLKEINREKI
jgi:tRNA A-37 threonylcarbamoyl transferase component Bud32